METLRTMQDIIRETKKCGPVKTAVAGPHDELTVKVVLQGLDEGLISPVLFGEGMKIKALLGERCREVEVIDCEDYVQEAVSATREDQCQLLMKGSISTPKLLSKCLSKSTGINLGKAICSVVVSDIPGWNRLLAVSDVGLNILPSIEQKIEMARTMIQLLHILGIDEPKIAVLASAEEVGTKNPATVDAAVLTQMNRRGQLSGAVIDGPLALDNIISAEAAKKKHIESEVAGCADGIIVPNIESGNVLAKSLTYFAKATNASVVLGAKVPIVLPSRSGKPETKLGALALGALAAARKGEK